jgi:tRNA uridine 5-carbamoylmethylation protein Kti12
MAMAKNLVQATKQQHLENAAFTEDDQDLVRMDESDGV